MIKMWKRFRDWLIRKLGGIPKEVHFERLTEQYERVADLTKELDAWKGFRYVGNSEIRKTEKFIAEIDIPSYLREPLRPEDVEMLKDQLAFKLARLMMKHGAVSLREFQSGGTAPGAVPAKLQGTVMAAIPTVPKPWGGPFC